MSAEPQAKRRKVEVVDEAEAIRNGAFGLLMLASPDTDIADLEDFLYGEEKEITCDPMNLYRSMNGHHVWGEWWHDSHVWARDGHPHLRHQVLVEVVKAFERRGVDFNSTKDTEVNFMSFHAACTTRRALARAMLTLKSVDVDHQFTPFGVDGCLTPLECAMPLQNDTCDDTFTLLLELIDRSSEVTRSKHSEIHLTNGFVTPLTVLAYISKDMEKYKTPFLHLLSKAELGGTGLDLRPTIQTLSTCTDLTDLDHLILKRHREVQEYQAGLPLTLRATLDNTLPIRDLVLLIVSYMLKP